LKKNKKILYSILDWGLGHATRSIPIIDELLNWGHEVVIGSNGRALYLLKETYPELKFIELPDYNIKYFTKSMFLNMALQWYKMPLAIHREYLKVKEFLKNNSIDLIISDNRYGCYSKSIPSIIISHQLNLKTGNFVIDYFANKINHFWIKKFDKIWVPDFEDSKISGELSKDSKLKNIRFIGAISRMKKKKLPIVRDIIVLLSGPEPQRSIFEKEIIIQLDNLPYNALIVGGKTEKYYKEKISPNIEYQSFLTGEMLNNAILESKYIITRSGYTTLLDLVALNKMALLIPTPGQTEQKYLAESLARKKIFPFQFQNELDIEKGIEKIDSYFGFEKIQNKNDLINRLF